MGKLASVKQALWNPQTKTCLGRTPDSWLKIVAFYICLYSCLAAIWSAYYGLFHLTISDKAPKWTLGESLIGTNPGVGLRPHSPRHRVESALISFREGPAGDYQHWVEDISAYLSEFDAPAPSAAAAAAAAAEGEQVNQTGPGRAAINCEANKSEQEARESFCPFDNSTIPAECTAAQNFSFPAGAPCLLVKLNRIYGWRPEPYAERPAGYPEGAPFTPGNIQITCEGQHDPDKEHLGPLEYFPANGIELKYYPFFNQPGYQSPYVMVHFKEPKRNTLIYVECRAWAKNIEHDRYHRKGLTTFELFVERPPTAQEPPA